MYMYQDSTERNTCHLVISDRRGSRAHIKSSLSLDINSRDPPPSTRREVSHLATVVGSSHGAADILDQTLVKGTQVGDN